MCKSTKVKYGIESKPVEYREKLYQKLVNKMVRQEMDFFAQLNRSFKNNYNIDNVNLFDKIFVIKNIGDEFWFSLPTDENKQNSASNIIYSLFEAFNAIREDEIIIDEKELSIEEEMDWKADRNFLRLPVNYKIYVDIVDSYIDYTERRTTTFFENYYNIFSQMMNCQKKIKKKCLKKYLIIGIWELA